MTEEREGFLGRWARRKSDALQGKPLEEPAPAAAPGGNTGAIVPPPDGTQSASAAAPPPGPDALVPAEKELSLNDVRLLTKDSDFKPFMAEGVGPEVRNAAMKKLFADPHFNVMDGLDTYIDDYSVSEPIPESMLRQMASAKFLKLFDDEDDKDDKAEKDDQDEPEKIQSAVARENANNPDGETVAQSSENPDMTSPDPVNPDNLSHAGSLPDTGASQKDHAHTDLRLQPDHAPPAPGGGRGAQ